MVNNQKLNRKTKIYLWSLMLIGTNFFEFGNYFPFLNKTSRTCVFIIILSLITALAFSVSSTTKINYYKKRFLYNIGFLFVIMTLSLLLSLYYYSSYGYIFELLNEYIHYLAPIVGIFALSRMKSDILRKHFSNIIYLTCIISGFISTIAFICLVFFRINPLNISYITRNKLPSFNVGGILLIIGYIFSLVRILNKQQKKYDFLVLLFNFIQIFVFDRGRAFMITTIVTVVIIILFTRGKYTIEKFAFICFLSLAFIILILNLPKVQDYLIKYIQNDSSSLTRLEEIGYYWQQLIEKPFFGTGFIAVNSQAYILYRGGSTGLFAPMDLGLFGFINQHGIFSMIWFVCFVIILTKIIRQGEKSETKSVLFFMLINILLTSFTLFFMRENSTDQLLYVAIIAYLVPMKSRRFKFKTKVKNFGIYSKRGYSI